MKHTASAWDWLRQLPPAQRTSAPCYYGDREVQHSAFNQDYGILKLASQGGKLDLIDTIAVETTRHSTDFERTDLFAQYMAENLATSRRKFYLVSYIFGDASWRGVTHAVAVKICRETRTIEHQDSNGTPINPILLDPFRKHFPDYELHDYRVRQQTANYSCAQHTLANLVRFANNLPPIAGQEALLPAMLERHAATLLKEVSRRLAKRGLTDKEFALAVKANKERNPALLGNAEQFLQLNFVIRLAMDAEARKNPPQRPRKHLTPPEAFSTLAGG